MLLSQDQASGLRQWVSLHCVLAPCPSSFPLWNEVQIRGVSVMAGATWAFLCPHMAVVGGSLRYCAQTIWSVEPQKWGQTCFSLCLFYCKEHGDIRELSYLRPFWLDYKVISFISAYKLWYIVNFSESGMAECLSVKHLVIVPLYYSSGE